MLLCKVGVVNRRILWCGRSKSVPPCSFPPFPRDGCGRCGHERTVELTLSTPVHLQPDLIANSATFKNRFLKRILWKQNGALRAAMLVVLQFYTPICFPFRSFPTVACCASWRLLQIWCCFFAQVFLLTVAIGLLFSAVLSLSLRAHTLGTKCSPQCTSVGGSTKGVFGTSNAIVGTNELYIDGRLSNGLQSMPRAIFN